MKNNKEKIETMSKKILIDEDGCLVEYIPGFLGTFESTLLKDELSRMPFQQKSIKMFGKTHLVPRFTCSVVFDKDEKLQDYIYSGIKEIPVISPPILAEVHRQIEKYSGDTFNYGLLNYYRNGEDSVSPHKDNESTIVPDSTIASLSIGDGRDFVLKKDNGNRERIVVHLNHGDLLLMKGDTQKKWLHSIPKRKNAGERFNITLRLNKTK